MPSPVERTEDLLAHAGWVRRLAHHLVRDPERADDLVQETWVAALKSPPRTKGSVGATRAFLGRVLRNALFQDVRGERHRRAREESHARSEVDDASAALVDEVDSQRMLLEEVLQLGEPARRTLLMRYFRELSAAEIARREGLPAATVRSRLKRALDELRERLDARHGGDRSVWSIGILGWAHQPPVGAPFPVAPNSIGVTAAAHGIVLMKVAKVSAFAVLAIATAYGVSRIGRAPAVASPAVDAPVLAQPTEEKLEPAPVRAVEPPRDEVARAAVEPEPTPTAAIPEEAPVPADNEIMSRVSAVFVDRDGPVVPGVELRFEGLVSRPDRAPAQTAALSGSDGVAVLDVPIDGGRNFGVFRWSIEGYALGGAEAELERDGHTDLGTITLERGAPVSGRVVDPSGRPLVGARVWALDAAPLDGDPGQIERKGPATVLGAMFERDSTPSVRTDDDGVFRIPGVTPGARRVWAHADGTRYGSSTPVDIELGRELRGVEVVLAPLAAEDRIEGLVLDQDGQPVPNAQVRYALHADDFGMTSSVNADADGRFALVVWRSAPHSFTAQGADGLGSAHVASVEPGTLDLVLRLGDEEVLELVVTDPHGEPIESYEVTACVGTETSWSGHHEGGDHHPNGRMRVGKPAESFWLEVRAVGYALGKLGPYDADSVPGLLELTLEPAPGISGRVFIDGVPQAGARIGLYRKVDEDSRVFVNGFPALWQNTGEQDETNDEGRFTLMPRNDGEFRVRAMIEGRAPSESISLHLSANNGASDVDVHVGLGGTLIVQVVAPPGQSASGVVVAVTRGDGHPHTRRSDAEGRAVFEHLTPGRWDVQPTDQELKPFTTHSSSHGANADEPLPKPPSDVEVREGRDAHYTLTLVDDED